MIGNPPPLDPQILAELQVQNLFNYHTAVPNTLFRSYLGSIAGVYSMPELSALTTLTANNLGIGDVSGIEYATNIAYLSLFGNQIAELKVAALIDLETLNVFNNNLIELDVVTLTSLLILNADSNQLLALAVAALTNLTQLTARNNQLAVLDVAALTNLTLLRISDNQFAQTELETIVDDVWANRIALGANSCDIQLQDNPGSAATSTTKVSEIADLITAGCSVTI